MNYSNLIKVGQSDGPGVRVSLFVSGCEHLCKGCFNTAAFRYDAGQPFTVDTLSDILIALDDQFITGLSVLGGDPLMERNYPEVLRLIKATKLVHPTKTIWVWTGYTMDYVSDHYPELLWYIDALVDGKYEKDLSPVPYRGSSNQNIWYKKDGKFAVAAPDEIPTLK